MPNLKSMASGESSDSPLAASGLSGPDVMETSMKRLLAASLLLVLSCFGATAANFCYVTEFYLTADAGVQVARTPPLVDQTPVSVSGTAAQSAAFSGDTKLVRIECDTTVSFAFGANPTATTSNARMAASALEYFQVVAGQKVSFVTNN
jgi:hypothetical protein